MGISDLIACFIQDALDETDGGTVELQRGDLAQRFNCVPSQINYVMSTRFSPEHGYIVESRRGGNGYIRITRVQTDRKTLLMQVINSVGDSLDFQSARAITGNLTHGGAIDQNTGRILLAAISENALREVPKEVRNNVRMENRNTTLLTDSLNYDRLYNLGYFFDGGTLMDEQNVLTSEWGEYNPSTKQSVFNYNVKLVNPQFTLTSDTLEYNTQSKVAEIVGPSDILSDNNHIYSEQGTYNTATGKAALYQRSIITNDAKQLTGDTLFYDRNTGVGEAFSHMEMRDTINKNMMIGEYGYYNEKTKYAFATNKAVAIDYSQGDSLFLHADTLMMETFHLDTDSMHREMRAFHKVRFYRTDMQGVADSLVFATKDSCLTLYKDPILWNQNQQLVGEKVCIYFNDSTIERAHIINQALSVEQIDSTKYNQVSGKEMKSYFRNKQMYKTEVIGSVRVVYYPMDADSTLIGMNVSETSKLDVYLENQKLEKMVMSPKSSGTLYPMTQIPAGKDKLDNFVWFEYIRPKNKQDIFNWVPKKVTDQLKKSVRGPIELPNQHLFENKKKEE